MSLSGPAAVMLMNDHGHDVHIVHGTCVGMAAAGILAPGTMRNVRLTVFTATHLPGVGVSDWAQRCP